MGSAKGKTNSAPKFEEGAPPAPKPRSGFLGKVIDAASNTVKSEDFQKAVDKGVAATKAQPTKPMAVKPAEAVSSSEYGGREKTKRKPKSSTISKFTTAGQGLLK